MKSTKVSAEFWDREHGEGISTGIIERCDEYGRGSRKGAETQGRLKDDGRRGRGYRRGEESYTRIRSGWFPVIGSAGMMILVVLTRPWQQAGGGTQVLRLPIDKGQRSTDRKRSGVSRGHR